MQSELPTIFTLPVPFAGPPQSEAVCVSPTSGSVTGVQTVMVESSGNIISLVVITGGSLTAVT